MTTGMISPLTSRPTVDNPIEPRRRAILAALAITSLFVFITRWPVMRPQPFDSDEIGFLAQTASHWFPMHHTLFLMSARVLGLICGDAYRGFIILDMVMSAGALVSAWWMLRAFVKPATAAAAAIMLGVAPVFWGYGAMAGNYTAIVLVGSFLLGVAYRGGSEPESWHPFAAAVVLAIGTGYRPDIGTFWLPVLCVILWQHRWKRAIAAALLFTLLNLAWLAPMLHDAGGWARYRAASAEFAHSAGYLNSVWNLGVVDAPIRYSVKLGMALLWTLGPALVLVPRGAWRLARIHHPRLLGFLLAISVAPALASHLLVHFGVPGYAFHYVPALLILAALGAGHARTEKSDRSAFAVPSIEMLSQSALVQLIAVATVLAAMFWCYPTDYSQPGLRGSFDLAFCRFTRIGLKTPDPKRSPEYWRTANSPGHAGPPKAQRVDEG
jgi:hypothetical protein